MSGLSVWAQGNFGVSFGPAVLAREMRPVEICEELRTVLTAIEEGQELPGGEHEVVSRPIQQDLPGVQKP